MGKPLSFPARLWKWRLHRLLSREARQRFRLRFLIVGAGCGGTSLLTGVLDEHPQLEVGFEFKSVHCLMGEQMPPRYLPRRRSRLAHDRITVFMQYGGIRAENHPDKIWGNKITTEQIRGLEDHNAANPGRAIDTLDLFFRGYLRDVPVIFVLRDGRTCIASKLARNDSATIEIAVDKWRHSVRVYEYLRAHHPRLHVVRYEDLIDRPEESLRGACRFLGVDYDPSMLRGTASKKMPADYRRDGFDRARRDVRELTPDVLAQIAPELRALDYLSA